MPAPKHKATTPVRQKHNIWVVVPSPQMEPETITSDKDKLIFTPNSPYLITNRSHAATNNTAERSFVSGKSVYFNSETDVIYFRNMGEELDAIDAIVFLSEKECVQHIACDIESWAPSLDSTPNEFFWAVQKYKNLKEITFVMDKQNPSKRADVKKMFEEARVAVQKAQWQSPLLANIDDVGSWTVPKAKFIDQSDFLQG